MALILGIETSTEACSVSLARDGEPLAVLESGEGNDHARTLAPLIEEILSGGRYKPADLTAVAVSSGPGSYTGLRIGVSTAKGLCYGLGIPLISVGSLLSLATVAAVQYPGEMVPGAVLCPMIDARRMEVYACLYDHTLAPLSDVCAHIIDGKSFAGPIDSARSFLLFGNGAAKCREVLNGKKIKYLDVRPSAGGLIGPAWKNFTAGEFEDAAYFEPFYLKDFIVTTSRKSIFK